LFLVNWAPIGSDTDTDTDAPDLPAPLEYCRIWIMSEKKTKTLQKISSSGAVEIDPPEGVGEVPAAPVYFNAARHIPLIKSLARQGMRVGDIAAHCGVTGRSFGVWRSRFQAVEDAIQEGYKIATAIIENKLFETALGGGTVVETTHIEGETSGKYGGKYNEDKTVIKQLPPSVPAQMFILKNIAPDRWSDKQKVDHNMNITWNEVRQELTPEIRDQLKISPIPETPEA